MVRRAQLYKSAGSPLIHGRLKSRGFPWMPVLLSIVVLVALAAGAYWYFRIR